MKKEAETALLRKNLDAVLKKWRRVSPSVPTGGWIRNIREALDMTEDDLAQMMKVSGSSVSSLQNSEVKGTVALATMRRAAKAMQCSLVYALVPQKSLEKTLARRRLLVAFRQYSASSGPKTGALASPHATILAFAAKIPRKRLWKDLPKAIDRPKAETRAERKPLSAEERAEIVREAQEVLRLSEALAESEKKRNAAQSADEEGEDIGMLDKDVVERERNDLEEWKKGAAEPKAYVMKFRD